VKEDKSWFMVIQILEVHIYMVKIESSINSCTTNTRSQQLQNPSCQISSIVSLAK